MSTFVLKRLLAGLVLLLVISSATFVLLYISGTNIARNILGEAATEEQVAETANELGLNRPLIVQYWDWLSNALTGDFGVSYFTGQPVTQGIGSRLAVTLVLVIGAAILTGIFAALLGVWAAVRRGWVDKVLQAFAVLGFAIPSFLIAIGLVSLFALNLRWFKPTGYVAFATSPSGWLSSITLPIIALTIGGVGLVAAQVRGSVVDGLQQDYVRTLRSRGLSDTRVVYKHVLRNAAGPSLSVLAVHFVGLLGGAVVVEQIFAVPGLGQVAVSSTIQGDVPMVMGLVVVVAAIVVIVNLVIDLLHAWLNPKVRLT